jgi:periplasmic protein CpxP/Spy
MNRSIKFAGAAVLALGLASAGVAADEGFGRGEGRGGRKHGRHGDFMRGLNLTDDQKAQLKAMREQQRESLKPLADQQRALRDQIRQALESGNPDANRIGQLEIQSHKLRLQMKAEREKAMAAFVNVLTPEQKAQWEKAKQEREQRREQFRQKRGERSPGSQS